MSTSTTNSNQNGLDPVVTQNLFKSQQQTNADNLSSFTRMSESKDAQLNKLIDNWSAEHRDEMKSIKDMSTNMVGEMSKVMRGMMDFMQTQSKAFNSMTSDYFGSQAKMAVNQMVVA